MNRIQMPIRKRPEIGAPKTHVHQLCGPGCSCTAPVYAICRQCRLDAFNKQRAS